MKKRRAGLVLVLVGMFAMAIGIAWGEYNIWDSYRAGKEVSAVLESILLYRGDPAPVTDGDSASAAESAEPDDPEAIPDYKRNPEMDMPTLEIDGYRYIGTVTIPAIDLELPVMESWDYTRMKIAPCRYRGSAYLENLIICAHNYSSHFGRLKNLRIGDAVVFTDMNGNVFRYSVALMETLDGTAVEEMQSGEWKLTLFTCTLSGKTRVTVRCR